jgi:hypothetical protein
VRKPLRHRLLVFALAAAAAAAAVPALAAPRVPPAVNAQDRAAIIDDIASALGEIYVFPEPPRRWKSMCGASSRAAPTTASGPWTSSRKN